jgi:hypothetical protein
MMDNIISTAIIALVALIVLVILSFFIGRDSVVIPVEKLEWAEEKCATFGGIEEIYYRGNSVKCKDGTRITQ